MSDEEDRDEEEEEEEDGGGWIDRAWWCEVTRSKRERDEEDTHTN